MNIDTNALHKIGYGLYVVTVNDGVKDNGLIVNTVSQLTSNPLRVSVTVNKSNYSHDVIKEKGILNVNCLTVACPFSIFENFGFSSGRDTDKFQSVEFTRSENGLPVLKKYVNSFMSLKVEQYIDLDSHGMFICEVTESAVFNEAESMTYSYYHKNVKPKPKAKSLGYVCKICGYVYEGDPLPEDFVCPLCKHGAEFFEPVV